MIAFFDKATLLFDLRYRDRSPWFVAIELADVFCVDQIHFMQHVDGYDEKGNSPLADDLFKMIDLLRGDIVQRKRGL